MDDSVMYPLPQIDEYARKRGVCLLGETGTGVTHTLSMLMNADIEAKKRILLIDPYCDLINKLQESNNESQIWQLGAKDSSYFINLFATDSDNESFQVAENIIDLMYMLFDPHRTGVIGPRFEHAVRNTTIALLDAKQGSFINILKMLTDTKYLQSIIPSIKHESVKIYFNDQLKQTSDFHKSEVLDYIVSKLSVFVENSSFIGNLINESGRKSFTQLLTDSTQTIGLDLSLLNNQPKHLQAVANQLLFKQLSQLLKSENENLNNMTIYIDEVDKFNHEILNEILKDSRRNDIEVVYTVRSLSLANFEAQYTYLAGKSVVAYRIPPPDAKILEQYFEGFKNTAELATQQNFHFSARLRSQKGIKFKE